jgi:hypothetical protein
LFVSLGVLVFAVFGLGVMNVVDLIIKRDQHGKGLIAGGEDHP